MHIFSQIFSFSWFNSLSCPRWPFWGAQWAAQTEPNGGGRVTVSVPYLRLGCCLGYISVWWRVDVGAWRRIPRLARDVFWWTCVSLSRTEEMNSVWFAQRSETKAASNMEPALTLLTRAQTKKKGLKTSSSHKTCRYLLQNISPTA